MERSGLTDVDFFNQPVGPKNRHGVGFVELIETRVVQEPGDVDRRLQELALDRPGLMRVVSAAMLEAANTTPFHCANAPGTFAYQTGTWALRNEYVGDDWIIDRREGVEGIWHRHLNVRVIFSNVDLSCNPEHEPKPRSKKGAGSERACEGNLFGELPRYAPRPAGGGATFYLMMDESGLVELTRPVVTGGTFSAYIERLFLRDENNDGLTERLPLDDRDAVIDFDPEILRK